jgi:FeS assembly SUF system protein
MQGQEAQRDRPRTIKLPFRPLPDEGNPTLRAEVLDALKTVQDPEIPVDLVSLGLIYDMIIRQDGLVYIEMTLTTPACPVAGSLPAQVQNVISLVPGVSVVIVELVWDPIWSQDRMSEAAKLELGLL